MIMPKFIEESVAEMHRLSQELHGGLYAPNSTEFEAYATKGTSRKAISRKAISRKFGKWESFVAYCGLQSAPSRAYYYQAAKDRGESGYQAVKKRTAGTMAKLDEKLPIVIDEMKAERKQERDLLFCDAGFTCKEPTVKTIYCWRQHKYVPVQAYELI